jgi:hypothetical protein
MKFKPDSSFRYTVSYKTDLRKTFARIRRIQGKDLGKPQPTPVAPIHVASIVRKTSRGRS